MVEPHHEKTFFLGGGGGGGGGSTYVFATRIVQFLLYLYPTFQDLAFFCDCTGLFLSDPVVNLEDRFSHVAIQKGNNEQTIQ